MQTLELMRRRIQSAEDLYAVVRVMKALAAVGIRQFEKAVESLESYTHTIEMGLQVVLRHQPELQVAGEEDVPERVLSARGPAQGVIIFGSDQGMCGSFNEQVADFALEHMRDQSSSPQDRAVLAVGSRTVGRLEDAGHTPRRQFAVPSSVQGITPVVHDVLVEVEALRFGEAVERFDVFHHRPMDGAASQPHRLRLLPVDGQWLAGLGKRDWPSRSLPTFSMDWRRLFSALIRQHVFHVLYRAFAESLASENAGRLAAMQAAEKNIEDHLGVLTVRYHQQRQQAITEELLDIVSGFESLNVE